MAKLLASLQLPHPALATPGPRGGCAGVGCVKSSALGTFFGDTHHRLQRTHLARTAGTSHPPNCRYQPPTQLPAAATGRTTTPACPLKRGRKRTPRGKRAQLSRGVDCGQCCGVAKAKGASTGGEGQENILHCSAHGDGTAAKKSRDLGVCYCSRDYSPAVAPGCSTSQRAAVELPALQCVPKMIQRCRASSSAGNQQLAMPSPKNYVIE